MQSHGGYVVKRFIIILGFMSVSLYLCAAEITPDLSQSIVVETNKAIRDSCQQIIDGAKKQQQIVLEYMITKANISPIFWPIYAKHLFKQSAITAEDLLWLMREQEKPYHLSKENADDLFKVIILDNLKPPKKEIRINKKGIRSNDKEKTYKIINLLTAPALRNKEFFAPEYHKICGYMYVNEAKAALIIAADEGLNKAIKIILSNWQTSELKYLDEIMCTREERNDKAARRYLDPYIYDIKIYTLAKWILRDDGIYLYGKSANNSYITIAKEILQKYRGSNYKLDVLTFKLGLILHKNNDLPEDIDLSLLINKLDSPEGILAKDVNDLEISLIQKKFPYFSPKL